VILQNAAANGERNAAHVLKVHKERFKRQCRNPAESMSDDDDGSESTVQSISPDPPELKVQPIQHQVIPIQPRETVHLQRGESSRACYPLHALHTSSATYQSITSDGNGLQGFNYDQSHFTQQNVCAPTFDPNPIAHGLQPTMMHVEHHEPAHYPWEHSNGVHQRYLSNRTCAQARRERMEHFQA